MTEILPSILSADFARLGEQVAALEQAGCRMLHVDIMDGHFVPNLTIGPPVVASLRKATRLTLDVHLMITDPDRYAPLFIEAGADHVSVHQETCPHLDRTLKMIQGLGALAGVVINPATPLATLDEVLGFVDFVLIMSVNPGFGGQKFIPYTLDKVRRDRGHLSPSEHQQTCARPQDLPVSAARGEDRTGRSSVGDGHHLHPDGAWLRLPGGGRRRLQPAGSRDWASITMEADFCIEALEEALAKRGKPDIFNSDQGSQFTSVDFTGVLLKHGVAISMDGRGAWRDNVFVERLWRSVKYEEVYLRAYDSVSEARSSIGRYLAFYNHRRPHSSLDRRTPDEAYFTPSPLAAAA